MGRDGHRDGVRPDFVGRAGTDRRAERPSPRKAPERVFGPWDRLQILIEDTQGPVDVLTNMSPIPRRGAAGEACLLKISELTTEMFQNAKIYARFQRAAPATASTASSSGCGGAFETREWPCRRRSAPA